MKFFSNSTMALAIMLALMIVPVVSYGQKPKKKSEAAKTKTVSETLKKRDDIKMAYNPFADEELKISKKEKKEMKLGDVTLRIITGFDSTGNILVEYWQYSKGIGKNKTILYKYNKKGQQTKTIYKDASGETNRISERTYNKKGKVIKFSDDYNADGDPEMIKEYE